MGNSNVRIMKEKQILDILINHSIKGNDWLGREIYYIKA